MSTLKSRKSCERSWTHSKPCKSHVVYVIAPIANGALPFQATPLGAGTVQGRVCDERTDAYDVRSMTELHFVPVTTTDVAMGLGGNSPLIVRLDRL